MRKYVRTLALILISLSVMGCQTGYIIKSGYYQLKLLNKKESLNKALNDPRIDEETKRKIKLVQEAKKFAEDKLGLVHTKNYDSFVLLDDRYVVYAVTAAYQDRLEAFTWWFPIVGSVPYKGFFKKADAEAERAELDKKNLDVAVRGVSAYSTLGWFSDPLLSSMTAYDDMDLVETIIHETTHATLYIKSNADFNERFANFVGTEGMEEFFKAKEGPDSPTAKKASLRTEDSNTFGRFITAEVKAAEEFYGNNKGSPTLMKDREKLFADIKDRFKKNVVPVLKTDSYKYFSEQKVNNAVLLSYKTYYQDLGVFTSAFEKLGRDWPKFLEFFKSLKSSKEPEKDLRAFLNK